MGYRFRKSIKITKGLRLNVGKKSTSLTIGSGPIKHTINSKGKTTRTVSIPGTGMYHTETVNKGHSKENRRYQEERIYSPKTYKLAGASGIFAGIVFFLLGLLLLLLLPPLGLVFIVFGLFWFFVGINFIKKSKRGDD